MKKKTANNNNNNNMIKNEEEENRNIKWTNEELHYNNTNKCEEKWTFFLEW